MIFKNIHINIIIINVMVRWSACSSFKVNGFSKMMVMTLVEERSWTISGEKFATPKMFSKVIYLAWDIIILLLPWSHRRFVFWELSLGFNNFQGNGIFLKGEVLWFRIPSSNIPGYRIRQVWITYTSLAISFTAFILNFFCKSL